LAFFYNLASTLIACSRIQKGDVIVLQYPVKKYFSFICKMAHLKGAKTISLIHDLGSFRRKKLTVAQELKRLSHTDYIIATNQAMKLWLEQQGLEKPIGALGFHDYLSPAVAANKKHQPNEVWNIVYAGSLNLRKNAFILKMQELDYQFKFHLYGNMEDYDAVAKDKNIVWHGFMNADDFIKQVRGNFGLVWDGDSLEECHGDFGSYLKYNTPHKASFYLRAGLPIIIWKESAIASLVEERGVGFAINSLKELPICLKNISTEEYSAMLTKVKQLAIAINNGNNLKKAIEESKL
ncbi:MAG: galactofuranosyltransferase, partial [Prevotella sp.]|nr:galactofuranosyltransferase [Prevotella sp.]